MGVAEPLTEPIHPLDTYRFPLKLKISREPFSAKAPSFVSKRKPVVLVLIPFPTPSPAEYKEEHVLVYPVVAILPLPILSNILSELFMLTLSKSTVILLAQDGILLKSIAVPDVVATATPFVNFLSTYSVVASFVLLSPAAFVGAVGLPVKFGLDIGALVAS